MHQLVLGIDPGFTGAFCAINRTGDVYILDAPLCAPETLTARDKYRALNANKVATWIAKFPHIELVVLEKVHSAPGQGVASTFRFGETYGQIQGVLAGLGITRIIKTPPAVWKAKMSVTSNKETSLQLARQLAPKYAHLFSRKKDDGRAEAFLLAMFGARSLGWPHTGITGERHLDDIL